MLYPVYVHVGDAQHAHGMQFPDFPGCFSAADDWQDIPRMAQEAIECHMAGEGLPLPHATPLEELAGRDEYTGGVWMLVEIDVSRIDPSPQRVNISLPRSLLVEIDRYASEHGATRSGFLTEAARRAMA
ncbi:MAG: type II toxin-antitoxin system HicB family antitoxin [Betaproteobacteria bacterium]|nr:type II toxin-antitoxin system HicB family antitoxin [Betaproteobacteria bacterium]